MVKNLKKLEEILDYKFNDISYLQKALTHSSYNQDILSNNERIEFLGDKILGFLLSETIFEKFYNKQESFLSKIISYLGSRDVMSKIAKSMNLEDFIIITKLEDINDKILTSTCEAIIAAIYLDCKDIFVVKKYILQYWQKYIDDYSEGDTYLHFNPKSYVQEWAQKHKMGIPIYEIIKITGKEHDPEFHISIKLQEKTTQGKGHNKKLAQRDAANNFINKYKI